MLRGPVCTMRIYEYSSERIIRITFSQIFILIKQTVVEFMFQLEKRSMINAFSNPYFLT